MKYFIDTEDWNVYTSHELLDLFVDDESGDTFEEWLYSALSPSGSLLELTPVEADSSDATLGEVLKTINAKIDGVWCETLSCFLPIDSLQEDNPDAYLFIIDNYHVESIEPMVYGGKIEYTINVK